MIPFAAARVNASRNVPGPESALLVTVNTAGKAFKERVKNKKNNTNLLTNMVQASQGQFTIFICKTIVTIRLPDC